MSWSTDGHAVDRVVAWGTNRHVLCALQTSDVFRRYADQNRVGVIKLRSDESTDDGFRHVLSEGRANVTHSPDMIECRLGD